MNFARVIILVLLVVAASADSPQLVERWQKRFGREKMLDLLAWNNGRPDLVIHAGHADGVGIDEWVSYEFAKVRRLFAQWQLAGLTEIEYFNGIHQIWGHGAFEFLHRHLRWHQRSLQSQQRCIEKRSREEFYDLASCICYGNFTLADSTNGCSSSSVPIMFAVFLESGAPREANSQVR